jgi:hypothetical protein
MTPDETDRTERRARAMTSDQHEWTERRMRAILFEAGLPAPDEVEYDESSIWLRWHEQKLAVEIADIPAGPPPPFDPYDLERPFGGEPETYPPF